MENTIQSRGEQARHSVELLFQRQERARSWRNDPVHTTGAIGVGEAWSELQIKEGQRGVNAARERPFAAVAIAVTDEAVPLGALQHPLGATTELH